MNLHSIIGKTEVCLNNFDLEMNRMIWMKFDGENNMNLDVCIEYGWEFVMILTEIVLNGICGERLDVILGEEKLVIHSDFGLKSID